MKMVGWFVLFVLLVAPWTVESKCKSGSSLVHDKHMNWDSVDGDDESVSVSCDDGYLLVPENKTIVSCDNETHELIDPPSCKAIPSVGFYTTELNHNMNVSKLEISVEVTGNIVRTFNVTVSVKYPEDIRENEKRDFKLKSATIVFTKEENKKGNVIVTVKDIGESGINKNYNICLDVIGEEEIRAGVDESHRCILITVVNDNAAKLSVYEHPYTFTSNSQTLILNVGYRTCDIVIDITLTGPASKDQPPPSWTQTELTIPSTCVSVCVIDLMKESKVFTLEEKDIGSYIVKLTQANPDSGCKVDIDDTQTVTVEWILSLSQIKENSTELSLGSDETPTYKLLLDGYWTPDPIIDVHFKPKSDYSFLLNFSFANFSQLVNNKMHSRKQTVNITQLLNEINSTSCNLLADSGLLKLKVLTSSYVAMTTSSQNRMMIFIQYETNVSFRMAKYQQRNDNKPTVVIETTRCINLSNHITVTINKQTLKLVPVPVPKSNNTEWNVSIPDLKALETYTLTMTAVKNKDNIIIFGLAEAKYTSGAEVGFEKTVYDFDVKDKDIVINILASRDVKNSKLQDLVELTVIPDGILVGDVVGKDRGWEVKLTRKEDPSVSNSVTLTLTSKSSVVWITDKYKITTINVPVDVLEEQPKSSNTSWYSLMIGILIIALIVTVAAYIAYSNREQIINCFKDGSDGGHKGIITKARTRLRSRGAYKKLPNSVQDAMTGHND